jgi:hypothetical protein
MNDSPSGLSVSPEAITSLALTNTQSKNRNKDSIDNVIITINEKVNLTKQQHQVFKIICDTYEISFSEYMQQALVEVMRFDIEEGNFSNTLLEKIGSGNDSKNNDSASHSSDAQSLTDNSLDLFKKLQMQRVNT